MFPFPRPTITRCTLLLALLALLASLAVVLLVPGRSQAATPPAPDATLQQACLAGAAVAAGQTQLAADCARLLTAKDTLRGTAALNWSTDLAIARWDGVTVSGRTPRVTALRLARRSLTGTIPAALGGLSALQVLDLFANQLTGPIPAELGALGALLTLYLQNNQLTGPIPAALGGLPQLVVLELARNRLTGSIPAALGAAPKLVFLSLSGNALTGCLPAAVTRVGRHDLARLNLPNCPVTLTVTAGANGSVTPAAGTHAYSPNTAVTLTATPATGYQVAAWSGACAGTAAPAPTCTLTLTADTTVGVTFVRRHLLTLETRPGGSTTPAPGVHAYARGSTVTVTAVPSPGYAFQRWRGAWRGACPHTSPTCTVTMDRDKRLRATFTALPTHPLTLTAGANGMLTADPAGSTPVAGTVVTVTATPDAGYVLQSWGGACAATAASNPTCTVTMDAAKSVSATFAAITYTLTLTAGAHGTLTADPAAPTYPAGTAVTLTATPADGYQVAAWSGACAGTAAPATTCDLTMDAAQTAGVTFVRIHTLTLTAGAHGSLAASPTGPTYPVGTAVTVTATPARGYILTAWGGACASTAATSPTCTVTMAADRTVSATFAQATYSLTLSAGAHGRLTVTPVKTTYARGDTVTVAAQPDPGYVFGGWGGACRGTTVTCTLTMNADTTVRATFRLPTCAEGGAVANPATHLALARDCDHLLAARDLLASTGTLNWHPRTPMAQWTGVTVSGTPQRVTALQLATKGLTGQLSGRLGDLTGLETLVLNGNTLTGALPSKLGQLTRLTTLALKGNRFTGCVPPSLRTVSTHDLARLSLTDCAVPTDISYGDHTLTAGTYRYRWALGEAPLLFDVPAGMTLVLDGYVLEAPVDRLTGPPHGGLGLILSDVLGSSWIGLDVRRGGEWSRSLAPVPADTARSGTSPSTTGSLGAAFDQVAASSWLVGGAVPTTVLQTAAVRSDLQVADLGSRNARSAHGAVPRNLVWGETIRVCGDYEKITKAAIQMFNRGLKDKGYVAHDVFTWSAVCAPPAIAAKSELARAGEVLVDYVRVRAFWPSDPEDQRCSRATSPACIKFQNRVDEERYALRGDLKIFVNQTEFSLADDDPANRPTEFGAQFDTRRKLLAFTIAHELGHALGLADEYGYKRVKNKDGEWEWPCDPTITQRSLMACRPNSTELSQAGYADLQTYDYGTYAAIYQPRLVAPLPAKGGKPWVEKAPGKNAARFHFDARDVRVEQRIEIRLKDSKTGLWGEVLWLGKLDGNKNQQDQPGGTLGYVTERTNTKLLEDGQITPVQLENAFTAGTTYGIFSTTQAYLKGQKERPGDGKIGFVQEATIGKPSTGVTRYTLILQVIGKGTLTARAGSVTSTALRRPYDSGTVVTITATPAADNQFSQWRGDCRGQSKNKPCEVKMTRLRHVIARFGADAAPAKDCRFTATAGANGSVRVSGGAAGKCSASRTATATATPAADHVVERWSGACSGGAPTCTVTLEASKTARVTFVRNDCTFTATAGTGGSVRVQNGGAGKCSASRTATATATPAADHVVERWSGACSGGAPTCTVTLEASKTARVTFVRNDCTFTATAGTGGSVRVQNGGAGKCSASRTATATATPAAGYAVKGWSGACSGDARSCTVTLEASKTAQVTFVRNDCTFTATAGPGGSVRVSNGGAGTCSATRTATATATPAAGYAVKRWSGACSGSGRTCSVTLEASKTARVTFEKPQVVKRCTDPKPTTAQTLQGSERGTDVEGNAQRGKTRTVSQPQTRTVTCNGSTGQWVVGPWTNVGLPTYGPWTPVGDWSCRSKPAQPNNVTKTVTTKTPWGWNVSGNVARYQQTVTTRVDVRRWTWPGPKTCAWQLGAWERGTPTAKVVTKWTKVRPPNDVVKRTVSYNDYRWQTVFRGTYCTQYQERRTGTRSSYYSRPHVWGGQEWVDGTPSPTPFRTDPAVQWGGWARTGATRLCPSAAAVDGAVGGGSDHARPPAAQLPAGDYRFHWGDTVVTFQVPAGAVVELRARPGADGVPVAVFTAADGTELVVNPAQLPAVGADSGAGDGARAGGAEPPLVALARTLRQAPVAEETVPPATDQDCAVAAPDDQGTVAIALAAAPCTVIHGGGPVTVSRGAATRAFPLAADRDWLVLDGTGPDGAAAVTFVSIPEGGAITLALADGAELGRQVPPEHPELGAVFDALVPQPPPGDE